MPRRRPAETSLALVLAALGTACGGAPAPAPAAPQGPTACERVGDHVVGLLTVGYADAPAEERPTEVIDELTRLVVEQCARGGWSADAQGCFLELRSLEGDTAAWDRCAGYLTVEQRDALPRAIDAAFGERAPARGVR